MKRTAILIGALCALGVLADATLVRADALWTPGRAGAYRSSSSQPLSTSFAPLPNVGLLRGKRKHVVEVDLTIVDTGGAASTMDAYVTVNGVEMEAQAASAQRVDSCGLTDINCTLTGTYWADLDLLEAANPDVFVGEFLDIVPHVRSSPSTTASLSLRARLVKK